MRATYREHSATENLWPENTPINGGEWNISGCHIDYLHFIQPSKVHSLRFFLTWSVNLKSTLKYSFEKLVVKRRSVYIFRILCLLIVEAIWRAQTLFKIYLSWKVSSRQEDPGHEGRILLLESCNRNDRSSDLLGTSILGSELVLMLRWSVGKADSTRTAVALSWGAIWRTVD